MTTVVAFTHSEAVVRAADVIHVLHEGRLCESGSYEELTRSGSMLLELSNGGGHVVKAVEGAIGSLGKYDTKFLEDASTSGGGGFSKSVPTWKR